MEKSVYINQIGYLQDEKKYAYIRANLLADEKKFTIRRLNSEEIVFSGEVFLAPEDELTSEKFYIIDFSSLQITGNFIISIAGFESFPIEIYEKKSDAYDKLFYSALKYFYLSRCGEAIDGGKWSHEACHTGIAEVYGTKEKKTVVGGWHDAGDYGRYIVAGSKAVMDLLLAYQVVPDYSKFDILSEVRFELEWMIQLQREDGAVYHKISCYHFCDFINADEEKDSLVLAPVSTAATADFAGCLAYASTVFKSVDKDFSHKLLQAALKAQKYLDSHEDECFKNPQEITTGSYGDKNVKDERYFALCSLFAATGKYEFLQNALKMKTEAIFAQKNTNFPWQECFSWGFVSGYGTEILVKNKDLIKKVVVASEETLDIANAIIKEAEDAVLDTARKITDLSRKSTFGIGNKYMFWGSNGGVADEAHLLLLAYDISKNKEYLDYARRNLDYLLGCNPLGYCYITGNGYKSPENPHHRPSGAVKKVMPGMLAGGPCSGLLDETARQYLTGKPPLQCYIDKIESYSTNEVAIYWNSPFVYLIAKLGLV